MPIFSLISLFSKLRSICTLLEEAERTSVLQCSTPSHTQNVNSYRYLASPECIEGMGWWLMERLPNWSQFKTINPEPARTPVHTQSFALFPESHVSVLAPCIHGLCSCWTKHSIFHPFGNSDSSSLCTRPCTHC